MIGGQGNDLETLWLYETVHPFSFIRSSTLFEKAPLRSKIFLTRKQAFLVSYFASYRLALQKSETRKF